MSMSVFFLITCYSVAVSNYQYTIFFVKIFPTEKSLGISNIDIWHWRDISHKPNRYFLGSIVNFNIVNTQPSVDANGNLRFSQ